MFLKKREIKSVSYYHIYKGYECIKPIQNDHDLKILYSLAANFIYIYFLYTQIFTKPFLHHTIIDIVQNYTTLFSIPAWP